MELLAHLESRWDDVIVLFGQIVRATNVLSETEAKLRTKATGRKLPQPRMADCETKQTCRCSHCHDDGRPCSYWQSWKASCWLLVVLQQPRYIRVLQHLQVARGSQPGLVI